MLLLAYLLRTDVVPAELGHAFVKRLQQLMMMTNTLSTDEAAVNWVAKHFRQ